MADTDIQVRINATGGGSAASEVNKARAAVDSLAASGSDLGDKFGKKLSAVGMTTLNYEILRSIDYGGKAKPVIGALNLAWMSLANGVGLASSSLFPWIAGISAVIAVYSKMRSAHQDVSTALQKQFDAQVTAGAETKKDVEIFDNLHAVYKDKLNPAIADYEKLIRKVNAANNEAQISTVRKQIEETTKSIAKIANETKFYNAVTAENQRQLDEIAKREARLGIVHRETSTAVSEHSKQIAVNDTKVKALSDTNTKLNATLIALQHGFSSAESYAESLTKQYEKNGKAAEEQAKKEAKSTADAISQLKARLKAMDDGYKKEDALHSKLLNDKFALEKSFMTNVISTNEVLLETEKQMFTDAYATFTKGFGDSFATMIVDGKSFQKSMEEVFKNILRSFISMVAEMTVRWAAMKFLTGGLGLDFGMHATGADYVVDRPTMFMAGENGAERVSVSPMGSNRGSGSSSSSSSTANVTNHFTITGAQDPQKIADVVAQKIIYSIRGRGQLSFVRS